MESVRGRDQRQHLGADFRQLAGSGLALAVNCARDPDCKRRADRLDDDAVQRTAIGTLSADRYQKN